MPSHPQSQSLAQWLVSLEEYLSCVCIDARFPMLVRAYHDGCTVCEAATLVDRLALVAP